MWICHGMYCIWKWASSCPKSPATRMFVQQLVKTSVKENTKAPPYWSFVRGIHRWSVDSPHKWVSNAKIISTIVWRYHAPHRKASNAEKTQGITSSWLQFVVMLFRQKIRFKLRWSHLPKGTGPAERELDYFTVLTWWLWYSRLSIPNFPNLW